MVSTFKSFVPGLFACLASPVFAQSLNASAPSFDCTKARGRIEKMICAETHLATLDRRAADLFAIAMAQASDAGEAKRAQRRWLGDRDDCKDVACVEQSYQLRL